MSTPIDIEFARKAEADTARAEYDHGLHDTDDRRLRTVTLDEEALTDRELDEIVAAAEAGLAEFEGPTQIPLTDRERQQIDFTEGRANVPWARSIKGIARSEGVDDWISFLDTTLTVDEHREVMRRAAREERGVRIDPEGDLPRADLEGALAEQCNHAEDVCRVGDPEACEFLGEACGFTEREIDAIMGIEIDEDPVPIEEVETPFTGPQLGALRRSWGGYFGAITDLEEALEAVREAEQHATDAIEAVNAIRAEAGQDPLEPERLQEIREMDMAEVCDLEDETVRALQAAA